MVSGIAQKAFPLNLFMQLFGKSRAVCVEESHKGKKHGETGTESIMVLFFLNPLIFNLGLNLEFQSKV